MTRQAARAVRLPHPDAEKPSPVAPGAVSSDPAAQASTPWLPALVQRSLSAVVLIPLVIALVFFGGWVAFGGAVLALLLGMYELNAMFAYKGWRPPLLLSALLGLTFLCAARLYILRPQPGPVLLILGVGVSALLILSFSWLILTRKHLESSVLEWALAMGSAFYLGWPLAFFLLLRGDTLGSANTGFWWMLALFFITWADDTFAYFTGHFFGRTKLAPVISPAKTWEGFAGGLVFTVIAALLFTIALPAAFGHPLHATWYQAIILGALVAVTATVGDLAESLLKRGTGVKDSGKLVPGHGGLLDRMDSLLFAVLVVFFFALAVGDLPFLTR
jgi:phosphatidate cytidylyltransferase